MTDHVFYDEPAEKALLGACMLSPKAIGAAISVGVDATSFWSADHGTIFSTIMDLHDKEATVDAVTVGSELNRLGLLEKVGGGLALTTLISDAPSTSGAATYAATVVQYARDRFVYSELSTMLNGQFPAWRERAETLINTADSWVTEVEADGFYADMEAVMSGETFGEPPTIGLRSDGVCALFYAGKLNNIIGESESCKSFIIQHVCAEELNAGNAVIFLDFEKDAGSVAERLLAMGCDRQAIIDRFFYRRSEDRWTPADYAKLRMQVGHHKPTVCVIDGVTNAMTLEGLDPSSNPDTSKFYGALPMILAKENAAVIAVDHLVKSRDARVPGALGAQHKRAGIDGVSLKMVMVEQAGRGRTGRGYLTIDKDAPGWLRAHAVNGKSVADVVIRSDGDHVLVELNPSSQTETGPSTSGGIRRTGYMERVSKVLEGFGDQGASMRTVRTAVGGKVAWVADAVASLVTEGYVVVKVAGAANIHVSVKPFREAMPSGQVAHDDGDDLGLDE